MFYPKDVFIYDESWDIHPQANALKGTPLQLRDVFGFWIKDVLASNTVTEAFIYRMRQVLTDKLQGSGEEILALEKVYAVVNQAHFITAHPTGVAGVDYYFCGWAKFDAGADDTQVVINFDGTRWNENI
jgi:hypothetical protein